MNLTQDANDNDLDSLVGTLMQQLREDPPDWLSSSSSDLSTQAAITAVEDQQKMSETKEGMKDFPHFSEKTKAHWSEVSKSEKKGREWYEKAADWWSDPANAPATVDGVLGGFGELDKVDVVESSQFLNDVRTLLLREGGDKTSAAKSAVATATATATAVATAAATTTTRALDGGAGIGRVAKHLLSQFYDKVDLVEGNQRLIEAAPEYMRVGEPGDVNKKHESDDSEHLGELFCETLQDFTPKAEQYDCVWVQWVIIYLTDNDLIEFLKRCVVGLKKNGMIVIKENVLNTRLNANEFLVDEEDSSLTRSRPYLKWIFEQAGLEVFVETKQENWHRSMLPVMMYALVPKKN